MSEDHRIISHISLVPIKLARIVTKDGSCYRMPMRMLQAMDIRVGDTLRMTIKNEIVGVELSKRPENSKPFVCSM